MCIKISCLLVVQIKFQRGPYQGMDIGQLILTAIHTPAKTPHLAVLQHEKVGRNVSLKCTIYNIYIIYYIYKLYYLNLYIFYGFQNYSVRPLSSADHDYSRFFTPKFVHYPQVFLKYSQASIIGAFIFRGPRLSSVFSPKIYSSQVPRIIEVLSRTIQAFSERIRSAEECLRSWDMLGVCGMPFFKGTLLILSGISTQCP